MQTEEMVKQLSEGMIKAATKALINSLDNGIAIPYECRYKVPADFFEGVWKLVDKTKVQELMAKNIEQELADRIVNKLATEISTDIKQLLSNNDRREELRTYARTILSKWEISNERV